MHIEALEKTLFEADNHTTLWHAFTVPEGISQLLIRFRYEPLTLNDEMRSKTLITAAMAKYCPWEEPYQWQMYLPVQNLITLSLDDPIGYRGNAHRKDDNQVHTLSKHHTSPGFEVAPVIPGKWRAGIHIHSLVAAPCRLTLVIEGETHG